MLTSSSAAQFAPSSSATPTRTAVDAVPDAPSTGLVARAVTLVPVQQQVRERKSWSSAAEAHFAALPREVLEIIAADASDTLEEAQAVLGAFARVQQVDDKVARTWASDPLSQKRMQKENPGIEPLGQLLRKFSREQLPGLFPKLDDARDVLRGQARAKGYSEAEINAWLNSDNTLIQLIEKHESWLGGIPPGQGSDAVALHFVARGCDLISVPMALRSYRLCLMATSGPKADCWFGLHSVPTVHRTPELVRAAVSKHPDAIRFLDDEQRTIELYELAGERADFETFRKLPVTQQVAADPRYQAVLERLQKQAHLGLDRAGAPTQGGGGGGSSS